MLRELKISNYRVFESLTMEDLGRVNLIVGKNGSGKTSVLEAAALLATEGSPSMLYRILEQRGEVVVHERREFCDWYDISHLFRGRQLHPGKEVRIEGTGDESVQVRFEIQPYTIRKDEGGERASTYVAQGRLPEGTQCLRIATTPGNREWLYPLSADGEISGKHPEWGRVGDGVGERSLHVNLLPPAGLSDKDIRALWNEIELTPEEEHVLESLRILEPKIEGLRYLSGRSGSPAGSGHGNGFYCKLKGVDARIPLGSLGEGMKRLFGLAAAIVQSRNSLALIDEIDTGLHYSSMPDLWRMVIETARRLDVQVFATTHSQDCVNGLATLHRESSELTSDVRVHRVQTDMSKTVAYSPDQIEIADRHHVEVR